MGKLLNEQSDELEGFTEVQGPTGPYLLPNFQTTMSRLKPPSKDQMRPLVIGGTACASKCISDIEEHTAREMERLESIKLSNNEERRALSHDVDLLDDILDMMKSEAVRRSFKVREAQGAAQGEAVGEGEDSFVKAAFDDLMGQPLRPFSIGETKILQAASPMVVKLIQGGTDVHEACKTAVLWARSMTQVTQAQAEGRLA